MLPMILQLLAAAFVVSLAVTAGMLVVAPRLGFVDKPGGRKIHANPKPLLGGVGIVAGFLFPLAGGYLVFASTTFTPDHPQAALADGARQQIPLMLAFAAGVMVMHVMGLLDDRRALGPYSKLLVQLIVAGVLSVGFDLRAGHFLDAHVGGSWLSHTLTILWIVAVTNAFNFLDNMDGLSAGVAAVATTAFLVATLSIGQWFVASALAGLLGALLGFLVFNFPPARIFMGDSGSLVVGFVLGVLTVRATFLPPGVDFAEGWYVVFVPLLVLALPLYDLVVVSVWRIANGRSPFQGDTNHFSHRLVRRGMSRRTAVLCLYLVTASTSIAAVVLPHVASSFAAWALMTQTLLTLGVVMLLEQHPVRPIEHPDPPQATAD